MVGKDKELAALERAWRNSGPVGTRRQMLKWSAVAAGAVASTTSFASAAPAQRSTSRSLFQADDFDTDVTISVPLDPYGQPVTLDPHRSVNWGPFWALFPNVWGGLVRYDENAKVQLDLAESFTVSDDGKVYTFKIRSDAKYANGNPVLADHFITSWKRALNPDQPSPMAYFMEPVRNYPEVHAEDQRKHRVQGGRRHDRRDHTQQGLYLLHVVPGVVCLERRRSGDSRG